MSYSDTQTSDLNAQKYPNQEQEQEKVQGGKFLSIFESWRFRKLPSSESDCNPILQTKRVKAYGRIICLDNVLIKQLAEGTLKWRAKLNGTLRLNK